MFDHLRKISVFSQKIKNPFSLFTAVQILRAERIAQPLFVVFFSLAISAFIVCISSASFSSHSSLVFA